MAALITAFGRLEPSPEMAQRIASLLGMELERDSADEEPAPSQRAAPLPRPLDDPSEADDQDDDERPTPQPIEPRDAPDAEASGAGKKQLRLERMTEHTSTPPTLRGLAVTPASATSGSALPHEPLLRPLVTRAVVGASLARRVPHGPIDVAPLVQAIARRQPIGRIPRASVTGVAPSARVLIDCGPGMAPFARDAADLSAWVQAVASRDRTELLRFWQTPRKVGPSPRRAVPAALPRSGTVVVALTDLGIARAGTRVPGLAQHWLELDAELRAAGSSLVVFVPYPESRWPASLSEQLALVRWDRGTSLVDVRAARPTPRVRR